jgi:hypothetical protein
MKLCFPQKNYVENFIHKYVLFIHCCQDDQNNEDEMWGQVAHTGEMRNTIRIFTGKIWRDKLCLDGE